MVKYTLNNAPVYDVTGAIECMGIIVVNESFGGREDEPASRIS